MPVTLKIKGDDKRFPTPIKAIAAVLNGLRKPDSGVDPLALGHAACVASAQAIRTNTAAGRLALKTLNQMTEAFRSGDIDKGIRLAVVLGLDSLIINSKGAGINHPDTCVAFERAYAAWADVAIAGAPEAPSKEEPDAAEDDAIDSEPVEGDMVIDSEAMAGLDDMLFDDDDDDENDWMDD